MPSILAVHSVTALSPVMAGAQRLRVVPAVDRTKRDEAYFRNSSLKDGVNHHHELMAHY
jgi:hypothetical protein